MKLILFDDKGNSDRSINRLNHSRPSSDKRDWKMELVYKLVVQKVKEVLSEKTSNVEHIRTYTYTGECNSYALNEVKKSCGKSIQEINGLIGKENALLAKIHQMTGNESLKQDVRDHVNALKQVFQENKKEKIYTIEKQKHNYAAQKELFNTIKGIPFVELRTTPLVSRGGRIQQKGVDVKLATDLIQLAHANAYDVAVLMTGDTDLIESIKLVRQKMGKIIMLLAYNNSVPASARFNTINKKMIEESSDYFINTLDFTESEILSISERRHTTPSPSPYFLTPVN